MSILLVQSASAKGTASPVTVTLGSGVTGGNCLAASIGLAGSTPGTVTGVKTGSSADNWASAIAKTGTDCGAAIWTDQDCAAGGTSVVVTTSTSGALTGVFAVAEEWSGIKTSSAVDKTNSGSGSSTAFSSGATGTLSDAAEVILGCAAALYISGNVTLTGPGSPWTNFTDQTESGNASIAGYQVVSATTTETYSGTVSSSTGWAACIASLEAAAGTPRTDTASLTVTPSFTADRTRGKYRTGALTVTPSFTADRVRGKYRTASLTVTPSFTADRTQVHARTASLAVDPSFTADRTRGRYRTAALNLVPSFTARAAEARTATAALNLTPSFTASGVVTRPAPPTVRYPYHHREADR